MEIKQIYPNKTDSGNEVLKGSQRIYQNEPHKKQTIEELNIYSMEDTIYRYSKRWKGRMIDERLHKIFIDKV